MKKTGSDQTQPTFRVTVERLDTFEHYVLVATWTLRGGGPPTSVTYEWWHDLGPGLRFIEGDTASDVETEFSDTEDAEKQFLLKTGQDMLKAVASGNVFTPAPAPRRRKRTPT